VLKIFFEVTDEEWLNYFNVNIMGVVRLARGFMKEMLERNNHGRILIMSSESGMRINSEMIHYSVTKTALIGLGRGLAVMTKGTTVTVNSVLAGPTWTEGIEDYIKGLAKEKGQEVDQTASDYFVSQEPLSLVSRFIQPSELGDLCLFLCTKAAVIVNGSSQRAEGGLIQHI